MCYKSNEIVFVSENLWYLWDKNSNKRMVYLREYISYFIKLDCIVSLETKGFTWINKWLGFDVLKK